MQDKILQKFEPNFKTRRMKIDSFKRYKVQNVKNVFEITCLSF